ncbi:MAG TPA: zinc ribbon domain-containing protein [Chloroflexota bacterium]
MATLPPETTPEQGLICSNCHALNSAGASVCTACGVRLVNLPDAVVRLQEIERQEAAAHAAILQARTATRIDGEWRRSVRGLRRQMVWLLAAALVAAAAGLGVMRFHQHQLAVQAQHLASDYAAGMLCLSDTNFLCARDDFQALLLESPGYRDAADKLREARYGLARQYAAGGQWQKALDELNAVLNQKPGDAQALTQEHDVYNRWIADVSGHGDYLQALRLILQRDARFPPGQPDIYRET